VSATIDERIVEMKFNDSTFADGVRRTVTGLGLLKEKLNGLSGSESAINNLDAAGKKFSLGNIASGVDSIASKFTGMGVVGLTVLSNLTNRAVNAGISMLKALTIDPIKAGFSVYETKLNAIQVVLSNTKAAGTTLNQVTAALANLNTYANKTVYNFGQMAQNIGTFTAAGVGLNTAVSSIKGIANLAALSGSSAEQASTAMYQLSQAIAAGRVKLQDWNSVVNAGLGGKVFQNALIEDARVHGVAIDAMIKKDGGFRNTLQNGWLTSKILTDTLNTFTGDMSAAQLRSLGYTKQQTEAILAQAKAAVNSATQIRTITQLQAALKEEVATAWSQVWEAIIGNIGTATTLLTSVHNVLESLFTKPVYALANFLKAFDALGGRTVLIQAMTQAWKDLGLIFEPIKKAFQDIFPPASANALLGFVEGLFALANRLQLSAAGGKELRKTFDGLFSVVKIVLDVLGGVGSALGKVFGAAGGAATSGGGILSLTARLGDFLTNIRKVIESGGALNKFFDVLGNILELPFKGIEKITGSLGGLSGVISKVTGFIKPFIQQIGSEFSKLGDAIAKGISSGGFSNVVNLLNQLLFGGVLLSIRKFISSLGKGGAADKPGLFDTIKESFESLTGALKSMQTALKSETLEKIAIAVALLVASIVALSFIDVKNLAKSIGAITILFGELMLALAVVTRIAGSAGVLKMAAVGVALNLLATAILILSGAVAILAQFSWTQLAKGLSAIAILLTLLVGATNLMATNVKGLVASAYSMQVMAIALNVLALAVERLSKIPFASLAKGIGAIAALLLILGAFNKFGGGVGLVSTAAAMLVLGVALNVIAKAVETLGSMSTDTLAKGLISVAAALLIIALAMNLMPPTMIATSVALLLVAGALVLLSKALTTMGALSWSAVARSLVLLAGSLALIAVAMILMTEALPGAAALVVVAAALSLLAPVLKVFSELSWEGIAKALLTLAGVFLVIAAAGIILTPLIPTLLGLGLAITLLGVGILAAGAGVALFAIGLTALAVAVTASGAAILSFVTSILGLIPAVLKQLGAGVIAFADVIGKGGPAIARAVQAILTALLTAIIKVVPLAAKAFGTVLTAIITAVDKYAPKIIATIGNLVLRLLEAVAKYYPQFIVAGLHLIENLLNGLANNIPKIAAAAVRVVVAFITAIGVSELAIIRAGANMIINFINGLAAEIRKDGPRLGAAGGNLATAIIQGMAIGLANGVGTIVSAAANLGTSAWHAAMHAVGAASPAKKFIDVGEFSGEGFAIGLDNKVQRVSDSAAAVGSSALSAIQQSLSGLDGVVNDSLNLSPKITPVIDLTEATKGFNALNNLSKSQIINATASSSTASSISASNAAASAAIAASQTASIGKSLTFNQYNTSPVALSDATIYRQTKNQLSIVRGALPG